MTKPSLRLRYLATYLLFLIPILIFTMILYQSAADRGIQYTNTTAMQQFTYAAENIASIVNKFGYSAGSAFLLEEQLRTQADGKVQVLDEDRLHNILAAMEKSLTPSVDVLFYLRGDQYLYTSEGRRHYAEWEKEYTEDYNLPMSKMYTNLNVSEKATMVPLYSAADVTTPHGLAYMIPFPLGQEGRAPAALIYLLHNRVLEEEFKNYLGSIPGDLFLYNEKYRQLFVYLDGETPRIPFEDMVKQRGVGLQTLTWGGHGLVLLRVSNSALDLHCAMIVENGRFYDGVQGSQRFFLILISVLLVLLCVLAIWTAFFNYKPIRDLVEHVTRGGKKQAGRVNEIELIKSYYDQSIGEAEELSLQLSELTPIVTQQLVNKLIFGMIPSRDDFYALSRSAGIPFLRPYSVALYVLIFSEKPDDGHEDMDRSALIASRFRPPNCGVAYGELPSENALCLIVNFDCSPEALDGMGREFAQQLIGALNNGGILSARIGIGLPYEDPMKMPDSFAEASTAVQLAPPSRETLFVYEPLAVKPEGSANVREGFRGISNQSLALLTTSIQRGEKSVAFRALHDILYEISTATDSFVYFRFHCSELLGAMIRQANALEIPLEQARLNGLIGFQSQSELAQKASEVLEYLCGEMHARIQREDEQIKRRVLDYILEHYKRFDLSIQGVSDALNIRKTHITALLKENTGQNFVQYVSYLRMNEFKRLLLETDRTIQELVNEIGYSDVPNFLRKFKSVEGVTPRQYRSLNGCP